VFHNVEVIFYDFDIKRLELYFVEFVLVLNTIHWTLNNNQSINQSYFNLSI